MDWFVIHLVFVFFTCFTQGFNFSCQSVLRWNRQKESKGDTWWTKDYYIDINTKIMHHLFLRYRNFIACLLQFASLLFYQLSLPLQIPFLPDKPACGCMRYIACTTLWRTGYHLLFIHAVVMGHRPRSKTTMLVGWWEETFTCPACELALHSLHLAALQEISMIGLVNCTSQREPAQCTRSEWQSVPTSNKISVCSHILWSFTQDYLSFRLKSFPFRFWFPSVSTSSLRCHSPLRFKKLALLLQFLVSYS